MENKNVFAGLVIAAVVIGLAIFGSVGSLTGAISDTSNKVISGLKTNVGGERSGLQEFTGGIKPGDYSIKTKTISIPRGTNRVTFKNPEGKTIYVSAPSMSMGYSSGTASGTPTFYVGTTTAGNESTAFADYARPTPTRLLIDGAIIATSTGPQIIVGTTTSTGIGFAVGTGDSIVFDVQEHFFCGSAGNFPVGSCETATTTNTTITSYFGRFTYTY